LKALQRIGAGSGEIFLQTAALEEAEQFAGWLTAAETAQAARMVNPALRTRFVVSRGLRRRLLAECTGREAAALDFAEDGVVKPRLLDADGWDFNTSHAGDHVVVAARRGPIGVDLEQHREVRERAGIVRRYFHADEAVAWKRLPKAQQADAFFVFWSAREAAMKCAGLGLAKGVSVTRVGPEILQGGEADGASGDMLLKVKILESPHGYTLAVAWADG
jgi:4'-phosphopantetheinyl transferase